VTISILQEVTVTIATYPPGGKSADGRLDPHWTDRAACRAPGIDPELFFPIGDSGPALVQGAIAKDVCARCLVRQSCLTSALRRGEAHGIWGGTTPEERRGLRARLASGTDDAVARIAGLFAVAALPRLADVSPSRGQLGPDRFAPQNVLIKQNPQKPHNGTP
jgi:WhiB family redox-sensing transcriptional regulator